LIINPDTVIQEHTAKNKDYKIMLRDNSLFIPQTSDNRETKWRKFSYYIWHAVLEVKETNT
jgi:hypothetical protein